MGLCLKLLCFLQAMKAAGASKTMKVTKKKAVRAMPKSGIAAQVAESTGLKKSEVTQILASLADIGTAEVKKTGAGSFQSGVFPPLCRWETRVWPQQLR